MLEMEIKFRVTGFDLVMERLATLGAIPASILTNSDLYFNAPDRDFRQTGEAFRLRSIGEEHRITYKGPKQSDLVKTRAELEFVIGTGPKLFKNMVQLLESLGYRQVACVLKSRRPFHLSHKGMDIEVCLDDVEKVGTFVEVEAIIEADATDKARAIVLEVAAIVQGVPESQLQIEPRSYLRMLLEIQGIDR